MGNQQLTYSIPVGDKKEGESHVYRHPLSINGLKDNLDGMNTLQQLFIKNTKQFSKLPLLGTQVKAEDNKKKYVYKTYGDCLELATILGSGVINLNLIPEIREYQDKQLKLIGIYAKNREEWFLLEYANMLYGNTMIPLYDTLGIETIPFVLNQSEINTLFCSEQSVQMLMKVQDLGQLKTIVTLDQLSEQLTQQVKEKGLKLYTFQEIMEAGKQKKQDYAKVLPDDVFTFSYTSGTTGNPKGAMITHLNLMTTVDSIRSRNIFITPNDVHLSYLPLPHVFERVFSIAFLAYGAVICIYGGDVNKLKDDLALARPTIFASVPRLFLRLFQTIKEKLESLQGFKKTLADRGYQAKLYYLKNGGHVTHRLWDKLVFNKTKEAFGGRVKFMITASAPISGEILDFIKIVACCPVMEGYGQTESTGGSFLTIPQDSISGHVGGPLTQNEFKTIDVPEMNYFSTDKNEEGVTVPRGEICFRGLSIFAGYYKDLEKTNEAVDKDGWLHSGDIGMILPNGSLKLFDRRKNIFKLQQGEYIAPEKIENIYLKVKGVAEVYVHGDSLQSYCVAIVGPNQQYVLDVAKQKGLEGSYQELCMNPEIIKHYFDLIDKQGKADKLNGMERVQKIYLESKSFLELGCVTNTMKVQRHLAKNVFKQQINNLYGI